MFGIGFPELLLIAVVALIFIGPKRLPDFMRQAGKIFVQVRRMASEARTGFDSVIRQAEDELRREEIEKIQKLLAVEAQSLKSAATDMTTSQTTSEPNTSTAHGHGSDGHSGPEAHESHGNTGESPIKL